MARQIIEGESFMAVLDTCDKCAKEPQSCPLISYVTQLVAIPDMDFRGALFNNPVTVTEQSLEAYYMEQASGEITCLDVTCGRKPGESYGDIKLSPGLNNSSTIRSPFCGSAVFKEVHKTLS